MSDQNPNLGAGYLGIQTQNTFGSKFNADVFLIWSILSRIGTSTVVQIKGVTNAGGVSPVGYVDVLPLVNQVDGAGNAIPHGIIYGIPYFRLQGGTNAIIMDPEIGDIGIAIFASRDISSVKANKAQANPGSQRKFDMADGIYIGGILNGTPAQCIQFSSSGISIKSPTEIDMDAPVVRIHASTSLHVDADGNGFVYTAGNREDYVDGSTSHSNPLNPPQVP